MKGIVKPVTKRAGAVVFGAMIRTKGAVRRSQARGQGTVLASKLWDKLMKGGGQ